MINEILRKNSISWLLEKKNERFSQLVVLGLRSCGFKEELKRHTGYQGIKLGANMLRTKLNSWQY